MTPAAQQSVAPGSAAARRAALLGWLDFALAVAATAGLAAAGLLALWRAAKRRR